MKRSKTNYLKKCNKKTLIVAIDIGKSVHYGYLRAPNGKEVKPFPIYNGHKSYENFWAKIATCKQSNGIEEVIAGFESTGPYAEPLIHFLATKPVKLLQVNPMHTKRLKELTGNSPHKTDKKDPRVIADIISLGHALSVVVPKGAAAELRRLSQARQRVSTNRTALVNQLHNLIYILFPEYTQVMKKITSKSSLYILKNHTSPEEILKCGFDRLQIVLKRVSLGRLKSGQAKALFEAARNTTGIDEGREGLLTEIRHLVSCIEHELAFMDHLENRMNHYLKQIPYSKNMLSIKGIGKITAAGLIGEVGDFRQFRTISEIMKLAGLDLYEISSGIHHGQRHISKRGRSYLRKLLFFVSLNTIRTNGIMHKRYLAMLERGMPKVKAIVAISRRLLRILFALVRNHSSYREDYDHQHSLRLAA